MQRQVPSIGRVLTMVVFALSVFGLLLVLWTAFGGAVPFQPHGYRFEISFGEASALTKESDVRISGVNVGKIKGINPEQDRVLVTVELEADYAPVPIDTRAILRTKTLLSEGYIDLTPGSPDAPKIEENGVLPASNVADSGELDKLLSTFDPKTRKALRNWLDQNAVAVKGRGPDLNMAFAYLAPLTDNLNRILEILNRDDEALKLFVKNGAEVFAALSQSGRIGSLVENANTVLAVTATNSSQLAETVRLLPKFLDEATATLVRADRFADDTDPLVAKLMPVADSLRPVMADTKEIAPDLKRIMEQLGPLFDASRKGLPALDKTIDNSRPLLAQLYPFLLTFNPMVEWLSQYDRETTALVGNAAAASQATDLPAGAVGPTHYLRAMLSMNPDSFAAYSSRLPSNRANPYDAPGNFDQLKTGLPVFSSTTCSSNPLPTVDPTDPAELKELMDQFVFNLGSTMAPPCVPQPNFNFQGKSLRYPHVEPQSP